MSAQLKACVSDASTGVVSRRAMVLPSKLQQVLEDLAVSTLQGRLQCSVGAAAESGRARQ